MKSKVQNLKASFGICYNNGPIKHQSYIDAFSPNKKGGVRKNAVCINWAECVIGQQLLRDSTNLFRQIS